MSSSLLLDTAAPALSSLRAYSCQLPSPASVRKSCAACWEASAGPELSRVPRRLSLPPVAQGGVQMHLFMCTHLLLCVCVQAEPGALLLSLCAGWVRTVGHYLVLPLQAAMGREKGVTCAGHGANVDYPNLHFRHFLFPGKRGKVKPILNHCGVYLALQQSHGLIAAFYWVTQVVCFWRKDGIKQRLKGSMLL